MLASLPSASADAAVEALKRAGYEHTTIIGEVLEFLPKCASAPEQVVFVASSDVPFDGVGTERPSVVQACGAEACNL